jgi:hypothetical protein
MSPCGCDHCRALTLDGWIMAIELALIGPSNIPKPQPYCATGYPMPVCAKPPRPDPMDIALWMHTL